jgi:hypothetical protein
MVLGNVKNRRQDHCRSSPGDPQHNESEESGTPIGCRTVIPRIDNFILGGMK